MATSHKPSPGSKSDKLWRDALMRAVKRADKGTNRLERLADQCVKEGLAGNMAAIKEIGDRLDGRAVQPIAGADGKGPATIRIENVIVDAKDPDSKDL